MGLSSLWPLSSIEMYFSLVPNMDAALTWLTLAARLAATSPEASRNLDLSPSGAVVSSDLAVLIAEVRAFTAPERAASMQRTPSTHPSWLLGVPSFEPDIAARAALSASDSSRFPCPGRLLCILAGESASRTGIPSDARCLVRPAP